MEAKVEVQEPVPAPRVLLGDRCECEEDFIYINQQSPS